MPPKESTIALVRCESYDREEVQDAVDRAVDLLGGMGRFVKPGDRVLLKPNLLSARPPDRRVTTDPSVVRAVARRVQQAGGRPVIGDSPALGSFKRVARKTGMADVAQDMGIDIIELNNPTRVPLPPGALHKTLEVASGALEADVVINLPKLKTHSQMLLTLGVKNLFGTVVAQRKAEWHYMTGVNRDTFASLHLDILMDRMEREFGVRAKLGKPQVAYKETITESAEGEGKYTRQTGGRGQYGHCKIHIDPLDEGEGFAFSDQIKGGAIPDEFVPSVEDGIREAMEVGILAGFPLTGVKVILLDGSFHEEDSTPIAFKIAGSLAFKDAASKASPTLLEPIMSLVVLSPDEYLGDIVSDIRTRRGKIEEMDMRGGSRVLKATVPLAEMFGYATSLRTLTQGRGVFSMEYFQYEPIPPAVREEIIARIEGRIPATR